MTATPENPVFLVAAERSGTTLLALMMNTHPQISWIAEFDFIIDELPEEGFISVEQFARRMQTNRIFQQSPWSLDPTQSFPSMAADFLRQRMAMDGKPLVGATVHRNFSDVLRIWPAARFIHLVRDPRDVARSCIQMGWSGNTWCAVKRWIEAEMQWNKLRTQLDTSRFMEVNYEAIVSDPESELRRACQFLGVDYQIEMLSYDKMSTYSKPDRSLINQWRSAASRKDIMLVEARAGHLLLERGYSLSGIPIRGPGPIEKILLQLQDKLYRFRFRWKKYGPGLMIRDVIGRRARLSRIRDQARLRMNEIERARLK